MWSTATVRPMDEVRNMHAADLVGSVTTRLAITQTAGSGQKQIAPGGTYLRRGLGGGEFILAPDAPPGWSQTPKAPAEKIENECCLGKTG